MASCFSGGIVGGKPITAPVRKADVVMRVRGIGRLEAAGSLRVTAPLSWKPITWLIPEGTIVKKGEVIARFEKKDIENEFLTAKADLAVAEAQLEQAKKELEAKKHELDATVKSLEADLVIAELELARLKGLPRPDEVRQKEAELRRAKATFDVAKEEYDRMARFSGQGFLADVEIRQMISEMKQAESGFICAQTALRTTKAGAHPDDIRKAELKVVQARIALQQAKDGMPDAVKQLGAAVEKQKAQAEKAKNALDEKQKDLTNADLPAPIDGMVVYRTVWQKKITKGVSMWKGCAIMDLPDLSKMIVKTKVREDQIHLVKVGQKVAVHVDALPNADFTGVVKEVGRIAKDKAEGDVIGFGQEKQDSGIKIFDVTVVIEQSDKRLVPNLVTRLEILVNELKDALVIPVDAVTEADGGKFVMVASGWRTQRTRVELGPESDDFVVVTSGLKEGDRVCLSGGARKKTEPTQGNKKPGSTKEASPP